MNLKDVVIVVPANDAEAILILKIAKTIGLSSVISLQPHGASLDKEKELIKKIKKGGWKIIVVVEMPGLKTEKKLLNLGFKLVIIDHHHYQNLDRSRNQRTKKNLPSSLEQFLQLFQLTDKKLFSLGFKPRLVRGLGIMDRGFVWALRREGYQEEEIKKIFGYQKKTTRPFFDQAEEKKNEQAARLVWQRRKSWQGFFIVSGYSKKGLRPYLSRLIALRYKKPVPLIIQERGRNTICVQESPYAQFLLKKFGGFTFGEGNNWGYKNNQGLPKVTLTAVKVFLAKISVNNK